MQEDVLGPETEVEEEPPVVTSEPVEPASILAAKEPAVRQSGRVRNRPDRMYFEPALAAIFFFFIKSCNYYYV